MSKSPQGSRRKRWLRSASKRGTPVSVDGQTLPPVQLVELSQRDRRSQRHRTHRHRRNPLRWRSRAVLRDAGGTLILERFDSLKHSHYRETAHFKSRFALSTPSRLLRACGSRAARVLVRSFTNAETNLQDSEARSLQGNISVWPDQRRALSPLTFLLTMGESYRPERCCGLH